jgi:conjugal transfer mating pair stabilization protein TraN
VKYNLHLMLIGLFLGLSGAIFADDMSSAFEDAKALADSRNAAIFSGVNEQTIADKLDYYGMPPAEASLFQDGQGQLTQPGLDKVNNCAGYIPTGNAMFDQECDAVNFIVDHRQTVQHVPLAPDDPVLQNTRNARNNAPAVFQNTGITSNNDGQCVAQTNTVPAVYAEKSCALIKEVAPHECLAPRDIVIAQQQDSVTGGIIHVLVSSDYDMSVCGQWHNNPNYEYVGSECVSKVPPFPLPPEISLADVAPDGCFTQKRGYVGLTGVEDHTECLIFDNDPECTYQSDAACQQTVTINEQQICVDQERIYSCRTAPSMDSTFLDCSGQKFCINGNCFNTGHQNDTDFAQAMSLVEATREAGVYLNENTWRIFDGDRGKCRIKLGGIMNCCSGSSGGSTFNNNLLFNLTVQAGKNVLSYGSKYLYDALYTSTAPDWIIKGMSAMMGVDPLKIPSGGLLSAFSPSLSYFGFSATLGSTPAPGFITSTLGFEGAIIDLGAPPIFGGEVVFGFDPTSFAITVAIMVLQELLSCEPDEQILSMKKGQNLCHRVGSYCSKRFFGVCLQRTRSYCCYNSRLGRIINAQGRAQIGKSWGSAKNANCAGFSHAEFASINFAALDLSEFSREVMTTVRLPNTSDLSDNARDVITRRTQSYYNRGTQIE